MAVHFSAGALPTLNKSYLQTSVKVTQHRFNLSKNAPFELFEAHLSAGAPAEATPRTNFP